MSFKKTYTEILEMMQDWALYTPNAREICRRAGVFPPRGTSTTGSIAEGVGAVGLTRGSGLDADLSDVAWFTTPVTNAHLVPYPVVRWNSIGEFADPEDPEFTFQGYDTDNSRITTHKSGIWEFEASIRIQMPISYAFSNTFILHIRVHGVSYVVDQVQVEPQATTGGLDEIVLNGQVQLYVPAYDQVSVTVSSSNTVSAAQGMYRIMNAQGNRFAGIYHGDLPEGSFIGDPDWF